MALWCRRSPGRRLPRAAATIPPASRPGSRSSSPTRVAQGISQRTVDAALSNVSYSNATIRLDRNQKVFKQSFETFSGRMIPPRMKRAQEHARQACEHLRAASSSSIGVPKEIVVAIWGLETDFGAVSSNNSVLSAVATLAYDCRRSDFFRGQLVDALHIIERGDLTPAQMIGGLHGEIGQTQFLPSSYVAFAVDFDGNGRADLIRSTGDVLASTANYMRGNGWRTGADWMPGSANFNVIKEWNKSEVYSRTVAEFATRMALAASGSGPWSARGRRVHVGLEQPHRKIPEIKLLVGAGAVDFAQRVVDGEFQLPVVRLHDDRKPGAEIAVVEIGAAGEAAAVFRFRAVQPEGEAERVAEDRVERALLQLGEQTARRA